MRWSEKPVYICCGHTDMRKSINGLMALVKDSFSLDPFSEALFAFCNRRRDRIKSWRDGDGFHYISTPRARTFSLAGGETATMLFDTRNYHI